MFRISDIKRSWRAITSMILTLVIVTSGASVAGAVGNTSQSISWSTTPPTPKFVGDADFTPSGATATSTLAVTYGVTNSAGICSYTGDGKIHLDGVGTCSVTVNQAGDSTYAAAPQITKTFYVMPANQKMLNGLTVCFTALWNHCEINGLSYGWDYTTSKYTTFVKAGEVASVLANQSSGATQLNGTSPAYPVSGTATGFYTNTSGANETVVCSISVTGTGRHSVTIGSTSLSVSASNGSSSSSRSGTIAAGETVAVSSDFSWTSNGGQPVRWVLPCTVNGHTFSTESLSSVIRPQITSVSPSTGLPTGGGSLVITGSNLGGVGSTVKVGNNSCVVTGTPTVTSITCTIPAATSGVADVTVTTAAGAVGTKVGAYSYEAASYPVPTNSVAPVISTSATSPYAVASSIASTLGTWNMNGDPTTTTTVKWQVCETALALLCADISGATGSPWSSTAAVAGKYLRSVVTATNNGGSATSNSNIIGPFAKANQTISITAPSSKSVGVSDFTPVIDYSPSLPLRVATLTSSTSNVCTIVGNKVHIVALGTCTIGASIAADDTLNSATASAVSFQVVQPSFNTPTLGVLKWNLPYSYQFEFTNPNATFAVASGSLPTGLTLSSSGLLSGTTWEKPLVSSFTFAVSATDGSGVVTTQPLTMTVQKGTLNLVDSGGFATRVINGSTYIYYTPTQAAIISGGTYPDTAGREVGWITYSSGSPNICSVRADGLLTVIASGACVINQSVPSNGSEWTTRIILSNVDVRLVVPPTPRKTNAITFPAPATQVASAADFNVVASATSKVAPTITSSTTSVCTVSGLTVHLVGPGTCTLTASGAGSATYADGTPVVRSFEVLTPPAAPTITAATAENALGGTALVTFSEGNNNGATVTGFKVTATPVNGAFGFPATASCASAGTPCLVQGLTPGIAYEFVATKLANVGTTPAMVDSEPFGPLTPTLPQALEFVSPGAKTPSSEPFKLFPVSDIGSVAVPVVTSLTPGVCTVVNNLVTVVGAGTCTLKADHAGGTFRGIEYGAAPAVNVSFSIATTNPAVTTALPLQAATVGSATTIANTSAKGTAAIPTTGAWSASGLPAGLTINTATGVISGKPTAAGVYDNIQVFLTDSAKITVSKTLSLTVVSAPGIVGPSTVALVAGSPVTVTDITALPGSSPIPSTGAWAVAVGSQPLPVGLTLNPDTGVVSGTPTVMGKTTVTLVLTDANGLTATKVLTFDVATGPSFQTPSVTMALTEGQKIAVAINPALAPDFLPGTAGKPAKGAWTFEPKAPSAALPDGISFNYDTGLITGAPLVAGHYEFDAIFTDAKGLKARKTYIFNVAEPPFISTAVMLPVYSVPASGTAPTFSVDLVGEPGTNTIPSTGAWSVSAPTLLPAGLTLNADTGVISGTPPTGLTKDYTFKIKLVDSLGLATEKIFTLPVIKAGSNKTTLNLPTEIASGTLFTDELFDLNGDSARSLAAAGASTQNLAVTYGVAPTSAKVCFVDADSMLHIIGVGSCSVTATSGTAAAKNVSMATQTFTVAKRSQVLTVTAPGEVIPGSNPQVIAPAATNDPAGFRIAASLSSGLDPVYTVVPAKNPDGTDREPNCAVDESGNVTWLYDMNLAETAPGFDVNGDKCRVAISHPGDANYGPVVTEFLDLVADKVEPAAPSDDDNVEPGVSMGLPRTGGTAYKGGVGFTVKVTPTGVTVQPISRGLYIGPITANITIEYKVNNQTQSQFCTTSFGIAIRDAKKNVITNPALETRAAIDAITKPYRAMPKGGPKGYLAGKSFTNSVTCALNKDAVAFFKAGGQLKANAEVIRDRRWPTTYKATKPNGERIAPRTVNWVLKVG